MRRPAQQYGPTASTAWAHPYRGVTGLAVFYNSGATAVDPNTAPGPAPSPADLAARAGQQPPVPQPAVPPAPANPGEQEVTFTQRRLTKMMSDEKEEGRRAAYRAIAEAAGIDPDAFDPSQFGEVFKQAEQARQQQMSEEQRRTEELARREQAIQAREDAAAAKEKAAADRDRDTRIRAALVSLGATGADLDDAAALLRVADDATDEDIATAAKELAERRKEMFGAAAPQTLPPAPSGGPASGNGPRPPAASGKDAVKAEARRWAETLGYGRPDTTT